uniref:Zinc-ribbon domain-containing protein n=1 Tax=Pfiesteria piscicida TaxID=71001 RepID=A3E3J5_PFIPI|nr:hypothetical protein [Pfiesteria piscicida]
MGRTLLTLSIAREVARLHGGRCLSTEYRGINAQLLWRCAVGHQWAASLNRVKNLRVWCTACKAASRAEVSLSRSDAIASKLGGRCLRRHHVDSDAYYVWRCAVGHEWIATRTSARRTWCTVCSATGRDGDRLRKAGSLAALNGGSCLASSVPNQRTHVKWQCAAGHQWFTTVAVVRRGSWCPHCAGKARLTLQDARVVAASRGGQCLSETYTSCSQILHWQCALGHKWQVALDNVRNKGTWCPECSAGRSERQVRHVLEHIFAGMKFPKRRPAFLRGPTGRALELDGFCEPLKLAFEYNGIQHYSQVQFFHRSSAQFHDLQVRDHWKQTLCDLFGIRLLIIPFSVKDRWTFIRSVLLRWFAITDIFPTALEP